MATASAREEIVEFVERLNRSRDSYLAGGINETQLRRELRRSSLRLKLHKDLPKTRAAARCGGEDDNDSL